MTTYDSLFAAACSNPSDFASRGVLADWCEENGREHESRAWRWLNEMGRVPGVDNESWRDPRWYWNYTYPPRSEPHCLPMLMTASFGGNGTLVPFFSAAHAFQHVINELAWHSQNSTPERFDFAAPWPPVRE